MNSIRLFKWFGVAAILLVVALGLGVGAARAQGSPSFTINNWSTNPADLERGKEFDLTFTFTNVGSAGVSEVMVSVGSGANFVGLSPAQYFGGVPTNVPLTATLRVAVSNSITTGHHGIPIQFSYQTDDFMHTPGSETHEIGVYVKGLSPSSGADTGRPQIVIEQAAIAPAAAGSGLDLTLTLHNTGNRIATAVIVNLENSQYFSPAEGGTAFALGKDIAVDKTAAITLPLVLIASPTERVVQSFRLEYGSYSGGSYQSTQDVPIDVSQAAAQSPRLLIEKYTTDPATISPGATFRLDIEVVNVGGGPARQVFFRLGKDSATLGPLAPLGSSNVRYLEEVGAATHVTVSYDLVADGDAEAGVVPIDLGLEYNDAYGVLKSETVTISLLVTAQPHFQVGLFDSVPDPITVGDTFEIPVEVINIGRTSVNVSTVEVTSDDLTITDGSLYVGPLDGGTSGTIVAKATALKAGAATVTVTINYLDSFQQPQTITQTLTFEIKEGEANASGQQGPDAAQNDGNLSFGERLLRAILGFLGLATRPAEVSAAATPGGGGVQVEVSP